MRKIIFLETILKNTFFKNTLPIIAICFIACQNKETSKPDKNESSINLKPKEHKHIQKSLDDILGKEDPKIGATGISFTVQCPALQNGEAVTFNSGLQSRNGKPVTDRSLYQMGSNLKSFAAVVILQLEEEGKLSLDDKVSKFFPDEYPKWNEITIKQLLNMTSKIPDDLIDTIKVVINDPKYNLMTDDILNLVKDKELLNKDWDYSNTNYVLIAKIIEQVTNLKLSDEIKSRIFKPLQLNHSYYLNHLPKEEVNKNDLENLMSGYIYIDNEIIKILQIKEDEIKKFNGLDIIDFSVSFAKASGSIASTTLDLNTYIRSLFSKDTNKNKNILSQKQFDKMISIVDMSKGQFLPNGVNEKQQSGCGLGIFEIYNSTLKTKEYLHTGQVLGFLSRVSYFPEKDASFVIGLNSIKSDTFKQINKVVEEIVLKNCF